MADEDEDEAEAPSRGRASEDTDDWLQCSPRRPRGRKERKGREARRARCCGEREGSKTNERRRRSEWREASKDTSPADPMLRMGGEGRGGAEEGAEDREGGCRGMAGGGEHMEAGGNGSDKLTIGGSPNTFVAEIRFFACLLDPCLTEMGYFRAPGGGWGWATVQASV